MVTNSCCRNWNRDLKYLNLSGNKRLEIKPSKNDRDSAREKSITDFSQLTKLRVLGLMDVTLMITNIPDGTEDRRVRLSGSMIRSMSYGMADSLGRNEHLSLVDMVVPDFRGLRNEWLVGLFDGQALSTGGSKISKFLHESVEFFLKDELGKLRPEETPVTALRRTFLNLNKELATAATQTLDEKGVGTASRHLSAGGNANSNALLGPADLTSGGVATVVYMAKNKLYVANVGDAMAVLTRTDGTFQPLTTKHNPGNVSEIERIHEAGGWVSRTGKLNDTLDTSRAFGYFHLMPALNAAPDIQEIALEGHEEMLILASRELWEFISLQSAVDIARTEKADLMRAAHKLRDMAIAYGATNKIMVMVLGVGDMKKPKRFPRTQSMSLGNSFADDDPFPTVKVTRKRGKEPDNSVGYSPPALWA
jgi:adenylate cyclase